MSVPTVIPEPYQIAATALAELKDADVYIYSAPISRAHARFFTRVVKSTEPKRTNAILILTTNGGDPDAAYIIAKCLVRNYPQRLTSCVFGPCKSAGTLIVSASKEIVMSDSGELGPLDIQIGKTDELFLRSSGLDINEAITYIKSLASDMFSSNLIHLKNGTSITTKTAADIAQSLATGFVTPLINQIDPIKIGETQRAMQITRDYGKILAPDCQGLDKLLTKYASHTFVIDREQATEIFKTVRAPEAKELELAETLEYNTFEQKNWINRISDLKVVPQHPPAPPSTVIAPQQPSAATASS